MLQDLLISKVRVKILVLFFGNPSQIFHVREIVRRTSEEINAVRRELAHLEKGGLLSSEWRANRRCYMLRKDYALYPELSAIVNKTSGLGGEIIKNKAKLGRIKYAILSRSFTVGKPYDPNKVDILIVGNVVLPELGALVRDEEARREREINFTPMTEEEFTFRKNRSDPFIFSILHEPRVMLIGDEEEMIKSA